MSEDRDEILYHIGLAYQGLEDFEKATEAYKEAMEFNLNNESVLYELTYCLEIMGALQKSIPYYQKFIDTDPYSEYAWYNMGIVYNKLKQFDKAIDAYEFAVAIDETFSSAHFNMGNTYMNLEKYDKAIASYLLTLEYEGPGPELYCHMGASYEKMGQYEIGIRYYTKASKIDQLYHQAWFGVGTCLAFKENWLEATHFFKKAIKIDPLNETYLNSLAASEYSLGNSVSAIETYEQLSQLESVKPAVWLDWSRIYYDQGDYKKALSVIERGLSETPDESTYLYRKAVYLLAYGRYKEAMVFLEQALILNYDGHAEVYVFFEDLTTQKALFKIIDQYRKDDQ